MFDRFFKKKGSSESKTSQIQPLSKKGEFSKDLENEVEIEYSQVPSPEQEEQMRKNALLIKKVEERDRKIESLGEFVAAEGKARKAEKDRDVEKLDKEAEIINEEEVKRDRKSVV